MSSRIIKVIGLSEPFFEGNCKRSEMFYANSKLEMAQEREKAKRRGMEIESWYAQTRQGCKLIGAWEFLELVRDKEIKHVKTVTCLICKGQGSKVQPNGWRYGCPVCNASGITRDGHWNNWREWQLREMKQEFAS